LINKLSKAKTTHLAVGVARHGEASSSTSNWLKMQIGSWEKEKVGVGNPGKGVSISILQQEMNTRRVSSA